MLSAPFSSEYGEKVIWYSGHTHPPAARLSPAFDLDYTDIHVFGGKCSILMLHHAFGTYMVNVVLSLRSSLCAADRRSQRLCILWRIGSSYHRLSKDRQRRTAHRRCAEGLPCGHGRLRGGLVDFQYRVYLTKLSVGHCVSLSLSWPEERGDRVFVTVRP